MDEGECPGGCGWVPRLCKCPGKAVNYRIKPEAWRRWLMDHGRPSTTPNPGPQAVHDVHRQGHIMLVWPGYWWKPEDLEPTTDPPVGPPPPAQPQKAAFQCNESAFSDRCGFPSTIDCARHPKSP